MDIVGRVKGILLNPREEWKTIAEETISVADMYKNYIVILAAIGPVASVIGMSIIGISTPFAAGSFRVPIGSSIASAIVQYALMLASVYLLALVIDALAPNFGGEKNLGQAFKVAVYSYTHGWVAAVFMVIPSLGILSILGLYGLYILYLGLPLLMKSPQEKSTGYTVAVIIAGIVIFAVVVALSHSFVSNPMPGVR